MPLIGDAVVDRWRERWHGQPLLKVAMPLIGDAVVDQVDWAISVVRRAVAMPLIGDAVVDSGITELKEQMQMLSQCL